jgi:hypothetical protein
MICSGEQRRVPSYIFEAYIIGWNPSLLEIHPLVVSQTLANLEGQLGEGAAEATGARERGAAPRERDSAQGVSVFRPGVTRPPE